jgi:hypothetical protein
VGFLVNTPHGSIVDLGTEFALTVAPEKSTEVYVFEGEVEVANLSGNELHILKSGAHLKIDSLGHVSSPISFVAENFQRLNKENKPLRTAYVHWPFEGESHSQLKDRGNGGFGQFYDLRLTESSPVKKQGKYGSAFYFNGKGQHLSSSFKGIGGGAARTISFWLRIPPDLKSGENYAIIAWGRLARSEKWQLGLNLQPRDGILGSIRTEFSEGYVIGTTDLRDGRWHHVSSVFIGGNSPDVATHIRHYIDGRLEGVSGFRSVKINTAVSGSGLEPVNLGRYINSKNWSLRGNIDEMYIFNSALSPAQIVLLRDKQLETE